jgi:[histone H3]-lysine79 N-trimethyltransferase
MSRFWFIVFIDYSVFRNPDDPNDTSFDPHPTLYPVAELEYPNTGASERYAGAVVSSLVNCSSPLRFILLTPKDNDHYDPIMCLESSLYTIIECMRQRWLILYSC